VKYDAVARTLHWLMAALLILMFLFGIQLEDLSLADRREALPMHASMGLLLLVLVLARLAWRRGHPPPPYPDGMSRRQQRAARAVVHVFYMLMIYQPIVGLLQAASYVDFEVMAFGVWNLTALLPSDQGLKAVFNQMHGTGGWLLAVLVIGHVGATLKHWLFDRDEIPARMIPFLKPPADPPPSA
jgi:cytochrome b561